MTSKCKSEPSSLSGSNESLNSNPVLSGAQAQSISGLFDCNTREKQEVTSPSPQSEALDEQMLALNIQDEVAEALEEDDEEAGDEWSVIDGHDHSDPVSAQHVPFVSSYDRLCALESSLSRDLVGHANFRQMPLAMQQNIKQVAHVLDNTVNSFDEKSLSEEECCEVTAKFEWFVDMKQKEMAWIEQNIVKATQHLPNVLHHYQGRVPITVLFFWQSKRPIEQNDGDILLLLGEVATAKVTLDFFEPGSAGDDALYWANDEQLKGILSASIGHVRAFAAFNKEATVRFVQQVSIGQRPGMLFLVQTGRANPFVLPEAVHNLQVLESNRTHVKVSWERPGGDHKYLTGVAVMRRFPAVDGQENEWHIVDMGPSTHTSYTFRNLEAGLEYEFGVSSCCDAGYCVPTSTGKVRTRKPAAPAELMLPKCTVHCHSADGVHWFTLPVRETFLDQDRKHMLRKLEVGQPSNEIRENKVLLVVGATGSGKSTLIAAMINYMYGVDRHDQHRLLLMVENTGRNQAHSQTTQITAFQMHWMPGMRVPFTLTVVDTPGFGDTEGLGRDKEITGQLKAAFESPDLGLTYLNGVAFVAQAGANRLTAAQKYVFDSILSVFGKDVAPNIFVMATFADNRRPQLEDALAEHRFPHQHMFVFNNSSFIIDRPSRGPINDLRKMIGFDLEKMAKMYWEMGHHSFQVFFQEFGHMSKVSLQMSREVLNERERLELKIDALRTDVNRGVAEMQLARDEYAIIEQLSARAMANKQYMIKKKVMRQRRVETTNHTTTCMDCDKTCHANCNVAKDEDKAKCSAMDGRRAVDSTCRICPKRCGWQRHNNRKFIIEDYEETIRETVADMKVKYDEGVQGLSAKENILWGIFKRYLEVQQQVIFDVTESRNCLARLDDIGLRAHPLSLVECIDQMIDSVKNEMPRKRNWQRRLDELANARATAKIMEDMRKQGQRYDPMAATNKQFDDMLSNEPQLPEAQASDPDLVADTYNMPTIFKRMKKFVFGLK